jgi:ABC-type polar amino acid transport system ATPase subunit
MLIAENLAKTYDGHQVLNDVSLSVEPGQIITVIGPSGAGKTSLLRALALIEPADGGRLSVDGQQFEFPWNDNGGSRPIPAPWPKLTVVFQQLFLWPHLTLRENILLPARNIPNKNLDKELAELAAWMEMEKFIDRYPNQVSGGQRQRAALARAILLKPSYLLLDEITSALDVVQVSKIVALLPKLAKTGIGMVLVTHLLNFARVSADKVIYLEGGKVLEAGSREILAKPKTRELKDFLKAAEQAS